MFNVQSAVNRVPTPFRRLFITVAPCSLVSSCFSSSFFASGDDNFAVRFYSQPYVRYSGEKILFARARGKVNDLDLD